MLGVSVSPPTACSAGRLELAQLLHELGDGELVCMVECARTLDGCSEMDRSRDWGSSLLTLAEVSDALWLC